MNITVRHAEPGDYEAVHRVFSGERAVAGTLQLPYPSPEKWRKRLSELPEGHYQLVACADGEVVGELTLWASNNSRLRHVGGLGMAVRDDWQGKGVGTALMRAALDLADNWLGLARMELHVYTDNTAAMSFRSTKSSAPGISSSPQNTPLTSGVPSSIKMTRSLRIL